MSHPTKERGPPATPGTRRPDRRWLVVLAVAVALALGVDLVRWELRTSTFQARWLTSVSADLTWEVAEGPSPSFVVPDAGPYDLRLGYARLPSMIQGAEENGFRIVEQARVSPRFRTSVEEWGLFPIYQTKAQAGLEVADRGSRRLFARPYPRHAYPSFASVPPVVWQTLLFIESRTILDPDRPKKNPAVEWSRLLRSGFGLGRRFLGGEGAIAGGSTLATQLEKFRHAPGGLTASPRAKLAQMASASLRAYQSGPETLPARRGIVLDYLNSLPLAAQRGEGEVTGLGDGLYAWFGRDFSEANRHLASVSPDVLAPYGPGLPDPGRVRPPGSPTAGTLWDHPSSGTWGEGYVLASAGRRTATSLVATTGDVQAQGAAYREVLSLLLAQRRPSFYLVQPNGAEALRVLVDQYLGVLQREGVIPAGLARAARDAEAELRTRSPAPAEVSFLDRKGVDAIRIGLLDILDVPSLHALDRLDLTVRTTLDGPAQRAATRLLGRMADRDFVRDRGFGGRGLLDRGDPARVVYSVVLHERTERGNLVRIETDNLDTPFSMNESSLLELGSTAKLRTLASYLEAVEDLHGRLAPLNPGTVARVQPAPDDRLTRWARARLLAEPRMDLAAFLEASMARTYSADPGERFVTGGGAQTFSNFDDTYDDASPTVAEAFRHSVNLVFIRMMQDVVNYHIHGTSPSRLNLLDEPDSARRQAYLSRFADREGRAFLTRFIPRFRGKGRDEILQSLLEMRRLSPQRIAWAYRTVASDASWEELEGLLRTTRPGGALSAVAVRDLFTRADPTGQSLADLGFLSSVHPLELWVARHLIEHPGASAPELVAASATARQDVYGWLFRTTRRDAQNTRIRSLLEVEAFTEIHAGWLRHGYPFDHIVPSLGSALGSSGDRPSALSDLVGIIANDGVAVPTYRLDELHFAGDTPFETRMTAEASDARRVMAPEVARILRSALVDVVEHGSGRRMSGALRRPDGTPVTVGGKTGTGENRYRSYGVDGRVSASRSVNRTAAFVFFIGDRFHGVVTAHVPGTAAAEFRFTSALATQLLKELAPALEELLLDGPAR